MYRTRERGEEVTGAGETGKKLTLRLLTLRVSQRGHRAGSRKRVENTGKQDTANNREIRQVRGDV